jgi:hypothetical protein
LNSDWADPNDLANLGSWLLPNTSTTTTRMMMMLHSLAISPIMGISFL